MNRGNHKKTSPNHLNKYMVTFSSILAIISLLDFIASGMEVELMMFFLHGFSASANNALYYAIELYNERGKL